MAKTITEDLQAAGIDAVYRDLHDVLSLDGFDALILGSAVYMGDWLHDAWRFIHQHGPTLAARQVWLFSSGPLGADAEGAALKEGLGRELVRATNAREHRTFAGRLESGSLSLGERLVVRMTHVQLGDYRDWAAIHTWSAGIARQLTETSANSLSNNHELIASLTRAL
jgi:menaquinone-dependent protoporphyrinogen oxidase